MSHLTDFQVQEFVSGDCFFLRGLFWKLHLRRCPVCRQKVEACRAIQKEQESLGLALKEYQEFSIQAEATMKLPKYQE